MNDPDAKVRCFGREAALSIEPVVAADGRTRTVNVDAARRLDAKRYDWTDKLVVQITGRELTDALATTLGLRPRLECLHHGPKRDKGYRLEHRAAGLAFAVFAAGRGLRQVVLAPSERVALSALLLHQLRRNHAELPAETLLRTLELCYASPPSPVVPGDDARARDESGRSGPGQG